jgi:ADP-heptose:LPS heptosyltransferase
MFPHVSLFQTMVRVFMSNILIIKLGALGDVVMATSLINQIQSFHSTDNIFLLTSEPYDKIFHTWKNLTVHTLKRKGIRNNLRTISWIRKKRFTTVYDLQSNDRSGLYCALSGIRRRVGNHPRYPYNVHPEEPYEGQCHIYDRMLAVLISAGIPATHTAPSLPASDQEKQHVRTWLKENSLVQKNFIIIHAGGSIQHPEKRWPYYEELAKKLSLNGMQIVWVGGDNDVEINKRMASVTGLNACNLFTFSELAELGRYASFAITNDSGPMHVFSCSGIPVYGLFGPTNWKRNHAVCQENRVISAQIEGVSTSDIEKFSPLPLTTISANIIINRLTRDDLH